MEQPPDAHHGHGWDLPPAAAVFVPLYPSHGLSRPHDRDAVHLRILAAMPAQLRASFWRTQTPFNF